MYNPIKVVIWGMFHLIIILVDVVEYYGDDDDDGKVVDVDVVLIDVLDAVVGAEKMSAAVDVVVFHLVRS